MKISVVTAVLNSANTLGNTLQSVLEQTYDDVECLVVDGGSSDGTVDVIREYEQKFGGRLRWISESDSGLYDAMNKGIEMSTGDVVGFINSDDYYHRKDILSIIAHELETHKEVGAVYGDLKYISKYDKRIIVRHYSSSHFSNWKFRFGIMPAHPTFFTYRHFYDDWGYFKANYQISGDFELLMRFMYTYKMKTRYLPIDFLRMRAGGLTTASFHNTLIVNKEIHRACKENNIRTFYPLIYSKYLFKVFQWSPQGFLHKLFNKL
ncbi:MAG: glycosyltransferase family 2 protein [Muribaculaceae bacterium]|nr:glycosyltransferase family 2 protein [Muribaculaceae bacterium]